MTSRHSGAGVKASNVDRPGWWQTPMWQDAVFAVAINSRAAAKRLAVPVEEIARRIAARHGVELTA